MSRQEIKEILHNIDVRVDVLDKDALAKTLSILLNLVERLSEENEKVKIENQRLRDENNRLKGEQGKPKIRGNKGRWQGQRLFFRKRAKSTNRKKEEKVQKQKEKNPN